MKCLLLLILLLGMVGCTGGDKYPEGLYAKMDTDKGMIVLKLEFEKTPITVANFVGLAEGKIKTNDKKENVPFYDALVFHRVVPDFVIQGGDPQGNGTGGPGYTFPDEFDPSLKHDSAGILSMANAGPGTNGSQFFITLNATPHLNGKHSVFGNVIQGMDVVKKIAQGDHIKTVKIVRVGDKAKTFQITQLVFDSLITTRQQTINVTEDQKSQEQLALIQKQWPNAIKNPSGLMYVVLKEGQGNKPIAGTKVTVHYTGKLLDGSIFDSSVQRNQPIEFAVGAGQVIKGWEEGIIDMKKGEKRILIIPPDLAYGKAGRPPVIPANAYLVFEVELLKF